MQKKEEDIESKNFFDTISKPHIDSFNNFIDKIQKFPNTLESYQFKIDSPTQKEINCIFFNL